MSTYSGAVLFMVAALVVTPENLLGEMSMDAQNGRL